MIISTLLNVILTVFSALLNLLPALPSLPAGITAVMDSLITMITNGLNVMANWFYMPVVVACLAIAVPIAKFNEIYAFIIWFLHKIPFIDIK